MLIGMVNKQIKKFNHKSILLIFIPLILSAFTHIWNPIGFPAIHVDEGHYMRRAMQVIEGLGFRNQIVHIFIHMTIHTLANYF